MAIVVTPENYLGIHFLPQVKEKLRLTDVGLEVQNNQVVRLDKTLPWHVHDRETKRARKAVIKSARLYSHIDNRVHRPEVFAIAYGKGRFDTFPEPVIYRLKKAMEHEERVQGLEINLDRVHKMGSNDFKYGDPTKDHVQVIRTNEDDGTYLIIFYQAGQRILDLEATYNAPMEEWYA
ncbi:hypothetical protein [Vibrio phage V-YDF132]|nr:hypothetical protein [Vibrio phage V-YDF132]